MALRTRLPRRGLLCHGGLGLAAACCTPFGIGRLRAEEILSLQEAAPGLFLHAGLQEDFSAANEGGIANLVLITGKDKAAIVDTGGSLVEGRAFLAAIRQRTSLPIAYVILTHAHPDHVFGNAAFADLPDKPVLIGHARLPRAMAERGPAYLANMQTIMGNVVAGTRIVPPERTVTPGHNLTLDLGDRPIELRAWETAHTDCDLSVIDHGSGTLIAGDLVTVDRLPVVDGSLSGWLRQLPALAACSADRVVPGHGPVSPWPAALAPERAYLTWLRQAVAAELQAGVQMDKVAERVRLPSDQHWLLAEEVHPRNVIATYKELEWE